MKQRVLKENNLESETSFNIFQILTKFQTIEASNWSLNKHFKIHSSFTSIFHIYIF